MSIDGVAQEEEQGLHVPVQVMLRLGGIFCHIREKFLQNTKKKKRKSTA